MKQIPIQQDPLQSLFFVYPLSEAVVILITFVTHLFQKKKYSVVVLLCAFLGLADALRLIGPCQYTLDMAVYLIRLVALEVPLGMYQVAVVPFPSWYIRIVDPLLELYDPFCFVMQNLALEFPFVWGNLTVELHLA